MRSARRTSILALASAAAASVLAVPLPAAAATAVHEDFEDGTADGFTVVTGAYSVVSDGSKDYRTTSSAARAVVGDPASTDVDVQADLKVASWSTATDRTAGLMARYTDTNNYYLFIYEDGQLKISKKIGGTLTVLASKAYTLDTGTWYHLGASVGGSTLRLAVNGVEQLSTTTTGLTAGRVGVISFDGDVRTDNFTAADVAAPPAGSAYDTAVLADSPAAYWRLGDGGTVVADATGHGHTGTYTGSPTATTLPNGDPATKFNGSTQYATIADGDYLSIPGTGQITVEAWLRPDVLQFSHQESTGYVHWMGKGTTGQHEYAARMYSLTNSESRPNRISGYSFNLGGGLGAGSYFQDTVTAGQWIHYTLVINTTNVSGAYPTGYTKIYKNGVLRDQDSLQDYAIVPGNGTAPFRIATRDFASYFEGAIGKVAVYNYELSGTRIAAHYAAM
ncbi:LamG-like jellyroll fold domain-containing protein [Hamadaea tsunoensis]|uniref:LamG-like jellyroll fold domain-containing protein n=1 Tax=Hamadaea tsunoensis TaxID=53368 RepID=UPI0003FA1752|nr:LamG-like jellyroll fold domain-containing protein [Hamadaea tsunoensis]